MNAGAENLVFVEYRPENISEKTILNVWRMTRADLNHFPDQLPSVFNIQITLPCAAPITGEQQP